ncbi:MAG: sugar ABC transporter permease [Chloroflexi bacterium]|nr:sugar ABC transporter permease [Chloroflexota bacterium]
MSALTRSLSDLSLRREAIAYALLLLAPAALLFLIVVGYPVVHSLLLTVTGPSPAPGQLGEFVGLDHWMRLADDPVFRQSLWQTVMYTVPSVAFGVVIAMGVALVLNERFPGRPIVRAALLIPWALPPVVVASMFQWFLDSRRGLLGAWLVDLGITEEAPIFFGGVPGTLFMLVAIHVWKTFPLLALMFLVALQYLPADSLHAARVDGATRWRRFRYVVLPFLKPTIAAAAIIQVLITVQMFDLIFALTGGGPGSYSTYNVYFYTFKTTFEQTQFGYGAVLAYVVTAIVAVSAVVITRGRARGAFGA